MQTNDKTKAAPGRRHGARARASGWAVTAAATLARSAVLAVVTTFACVPAPSLATRPDDQTSSRERRDGGKSVATGDAGPGLDSNDGGGASAATPPGVTDLFHREFGDPKNPSVVILHGGPGGNGAIYEETIAPRLSQLGFFVVTYDQRGSGRSPAAKPEDHTFAKATQDLDELIRSLALSSPILMGHSFGGTLAVKYLASRPRVAKGAVLVAGVLDYPRSLLKVLDLCAAYYADSFDSFFHEDDAAEIARLRARLFPRGFVPPFSFSRADLKAAYERGNDCGVNQPGLATAVESAATWARILMSAPNRDLLTNVSQGVSDAYDDNEHLNESEYSADFKKVSSELYGIYGAEDGEFSATHLAAISSIVTPAHFTLIPGAGHIVFVDDEGAFVNAFAKYARMMPAPQKP